MNLPFIGIRILAVDYFWCTRLTDGHTDEQTDRQTDRQNSTRPYARMHTQSHRPIDR